MGAIKWYKRDPDAALSGMFELSLEERGAYNTVLDLIYTRANNLPDDDHFVAGWMRVDVRVWRRIKKRLIELQKLRIEDGIIRNERADVEVLSALSRVVSARDAGIISGISRAAKSDMKSNEINEMNGTVVGTAASTGASTNHNQSKKEEKEKERKDKSFPKKASAWPDGMLVPDDWLRWACGEKGWTEKQARTEGQRFTDYALANRRTYADWQAAWRNWCRSPFQKTEGREQGALTL